jgi:fatty acid synthase subunit alpha
MVKDEPVKDLLGNINKDLVQQVLERKYGGDVSAVPTIDYLAVQSKDAPKTLPDITRTEVGNLVTFKFGSKLPETKSEERECPGADGFRHRYVLEGDIYSFLAYFILKSF